MSHETFTNNENEKTKENKMGLITQKIDEKNNLAYTEEIEKLIESYSELVENYCKNLKEAQENLKEFNRLITKKK